MSLLGIEPKRSLGQNFLVSDNVVDKIIEAACPEDFSRVFEIGPGLGALTDDLVARNNQLTLVELDSVFAQFWRDKSLKVTEADALKLDWSQQDWSVGPYLLVSNLPYQISSRLVVELSLIDPSFQRMVLMFQKEVAQRITAEPSTAQYGLLSVVAQVFWRPRLLLEAGAVDFMPKPKVASRVMVFERRTEIPGCADLGFFKFLKASFANRRKKLMPKLLDYQPKAELLKIFEELQFSEDIRAERLKPSDFIELYLRLKKG